ncbi:hypothetical protein RFI_14968 [Reticulomyxa filosa]|uniref:CRAL-TRIO domain-containing protein n=1 Tax=Reticulomyxa filosa TaxID=46433 RepID=X6N844_RETFI|nr:hypothetical protein RFI_14968 [Reticulomyxa filosa]|eukprot:ETO22231.1 hypothetical protein RFI_14968 [Reticulomyxa filosa]
MYACVYTCLYVFFLHTLGKKKKKNTKGKIEMLSWEGSKNYESFSHLIDKDALLEKYGGSLDLKYTYEFELEKYKEYLNANNDDLNRYQQWRYQQWRYQQWRYQQ